MSAESSSRQSANLKPLEFEGIAINANGVPASSPWLRGTRYPGTPCPHMIQPHRGCVPNDARTAETNVTALRFDVFGTGSQGRPHSTRSTLGWRTQRRWRISNWESVHNPGVNYGEFAPIKSQAGLNSYKISVKEWVAKTVSPISSRSLDEFLKGLGYLK